jgi:hypothetical protein
MKRIISLLLVLILTFSTIFSINVFAVSYPSISSSKYVEFKAQQNIDVYKDTACKTRGTSSPSKKYNASISSGDVCYIYKIEKNYIQVNYPTSSGRRTGYIKRNALFDKTAPIDYTSSSNAKVNIYKSSSGSYVAKGDKVWVVDTKKEYSGYQAVIYEAKSGKRAYKLGYVKTNDLEKINDAVYKKFKNKVTDLGSTKGAKLAIVTSQADPNWKDLLNSKKEVAQSVLDIVNTVNLRKGVMQVVGTSSVAVVSWNPAKLVEVLGADAVIGLTSCLVSEQHFNEAETAHNKFNSLIKKIPNDKAADVVFETFVEALSKYNAVIEANIDTVKRYSEKGNYTIDLLESYLTSVCEASIPASEYQAIVKTCKTMTTTTELIETVGSKYSGCQAMIETSKKWYAVWNKLK